MGGNIRYGVWVQDRPGAPLRDTGVSRSVKATARALALEEVSRGAVAAVLRTGAGSSVEVVAGPRAEMVPVPRSARAWWDAPELPGPGGRRGWFLRRRAARAGAAR